MAKKEKVQSSAHESEAPVGKPQASNEQILKELQGKNTAGSMHGSQADFYKHRMEVERLSKA